MKRHFGWTDIKVPVVGQGTWNMGRDGLEALRLGIELGLSHIDTAEMYTGSEEVVAEAIRGRRNEIFLVSKVLPSNASYKGTLRACDASLKRLKTDYLDVYLLHGWSGSEPIAETMRAMEELVAAGKTRHIGVSNLDLSQLKQAQKALPRSRIVCNQLLYHLRSRGIEHGLVPYCESQDIAVVGYSPFGQGDFPPANSKQGKALEKIASRHGKTPRQVALNFLTRRKSLFTIPKSSRPEHVRENAGATGWKLDDEDLKLIDSAFPPPAKDEPLDIF
jgi:diketogulonate reductase-like aldo/keto reductase